MASIKVHRLPRRTLEKVHLGQSFAEYDTTLRHQNVFVHTPALNAAADFSNPHCFFVGRRGTGKTTITRYLDANMSNVIVIRPELFSPSSSLLSLERFRDAKQRPFKSLVAAFRRSLQDEVLFAWQAADGTYRRSLMADLANEIQEVGDLDFDLRAITFIEELTKPLAENDDKEWIRSVKKPKTIAKAMESLATTPGYSVLLDAIDESWDGSELAVIYLAAMMHACVEINSNLSGMRVLMFLRENIFERVRVVDTEFARLETCVVGLDWSAEQLLEMVERRLNAPLTAKFPLNGATWDLFFEKGEVARDQIFTLCQHRPRDVLTYTGLALDTAQSHKHEQIMIEDLQDARRRFSTSRLNDLGDEYQENYPQISLVLERFYGLGRRWTLGGIDAFLTRLLHDSQVESGCKSWIYDHSDPQLFVRLLYNIGFLGIAQRKRSGQGEQVTYRSLGPRDTTPPPVTTSTDFVVHQSYWEALDLRDVLVRNFASDDQFQKVGLLTELPGALEFEEYRTKLDLLIEQLKSMPKGADDANAFEDIVGEVIRLCFFRVLDNVEEQVRNVDGTIRRDWVASNRAQSGFWELVNNRYQASQVVFECKNYENLSSGDFHQAQAYITRAGGRLVIMCFRGELKNHYFQHIRRCSNANDGMVLLFNDKDLMVFLRQARNGRPKEAHLYDRLDKTQRAIS